MLPHRGGVGYEICGLKRQDFEIEDAFGQPGGGDEDDKGGSKTQQRLLVEPGVAQEEGRRQKHGHDRQLPDFHAKIEAYESQSECAVDEAKLGQRVVKAEARCTSPKKKATIQPRSRTTDLPKIVGGGQHDGQRDGGFGEARRQPDNLQRSQAERDGMRGGEGRHNFKNVDERGPQCPETPAICRPPDATPPAAAMPPEKGCDHIPSRYEKSFRAEKREIAAQDW